MKETASGISRALSLKANVNSVQPGWLVANPFFPFLAIALSIKGIFLILDPSPQIFLGDSASYIQTALTGWIPPDRSFLYGFIIGLFSNYSGSLFSLVLAQVLSSAITAALAGYLLWRFTRTSGFLCATATGFCSLEPIQLMYERFVMAEATSLLAAIVFLFFVLLFINSGRNRYLVAASIAGLLAVALRISYLPVVIVISFSAPIIRYFSLRPAGQLISKHPAWSCIRSLAIIVVCHVALHSGYRFLNGRLYGNYPAYQYADGFSLLASWYPAMNASDLKAAGVPVAITKGLAPATLERRRSQRWSEDGIVTALTSYFHDPLAANKVAKGIALHIVKRDPVGVADLGLLTYFRAWRRDVIKTSIKEDTGATRPVPKQLLNSIARNYHIALDQNGNQKTLTKRYFSRLIAWYRLLLLSPLLLLISLAFVSPDERPFFVVLVLYSGILLLTACGLSVDNSIRYLHPLGWTILILIPYWMGRVRGGRSWSAHQ